jgi:antitoxin (DNA-binding transcriptional repressor) of toxin-antitoxin stability system
MREIGALEAAGQLGARLDLMEQGEEVVITRGGRAVARQAAGAMGVALLGQAG